VDGFRIANLQAACAGALSEPGLHNPSCQRDADPVQAAAKIVRQIPLGGGIDQKTVGDPDHKPANQKRRQETRA
jgi:hypothetical protein